MWILNRVRSGGPSGMRAEDLEEWLREASRETNPATHWWRLLVRIIQNNFDDGAVPEDLEWSTMVFLPKGRRGGVSVDRYW